MSETTASAERPSWMPELVWASPRFQMARAPLTPMQAAAFDDLVVDYRFVAMGKTGRAYVSYSVLAELVKRGWVKSE